MAKETMAIISKSELTSSKLSKNYSRRRVEEGDKINLL